MSRAGSTYLGFDFDLGFDLARHGVRHFLVSTLSVERLEWDASVGDPKVVLPLVRSVLPFQPVHNVDDENEIISNCGYS